MPKIIGERVLAIRDGDSDTLNVYGEGTYVGDKEPPDFPINNPCIHLDSGEIVWGYQCWWGPLDQALEKYKGATLVTVPVPEGNGRWDADGADSTQEQTTTPPDVYFTDDDFDRPDPNWNGKD